MLLKQYSDGVEILSVDEERLKKALMEISSKIKEDHPEVQEVILYGSFSKNEFTPRSDLDIAIILDQTEKPFLTRSDDFLEYFWSIPFDVNLVIYTKEEKEKMRAEDHRFLKEILNGTKLLG